MYKLISAKTAKAVEINWDNTIKTYSTWDEAFNAWQSMRAKGIVTFIVPA